jgi:hypothetical protein
MTKCTCAFAGIEFRMLGRLKAAHKPLGRQMAGEYIVGRTFVLILKGKMKVKFNSIIDCLENT